MLATVTLRRTERTRGLTHRTQMARVDTRVLAPNTKQPALA